MMFVKEVVVGIGVAPAKAGAAAEVRAICQTGPCLRRGDDSGFTLVELMVVLVIIGLLATIVIINVLPAQDKAMVGKAKADVALLDQGLEVYKLDNQTFPSGGEGLQALVTKGVIKKLPKDPWGRDYIYAAPGQHGAVDVYSLGADGAQGGEGENADIGNWQ
jgi:general secretion pathway protein G